MLALQGLAWAAAAGGAEETFWSFRPLGSPRLPEVRDKRWVAAPVDHFVLAPLEARGRAPGPAASRGVLIRRVAFDLIGLPPEPEKVDAFLADSSPRAYGKVVDRLLASPHFGERWGRHWLDVARYAEDDIRGLSQETYSNAWRYRDWVIRAFNDDLPFPLFLKAQIAGDLLAERDSRDLLPALGFFGLGPWYYDIAVPAVARADERHERVDALTRGFLGLTVACARCHDHKFDPFSMRDYYALAGVFASSEYREFPLAEPGVVAEYHRLEQMVKEQEEAVKEYGKESGERLAQILAAGTARYLEAAWQVLGPDRFDLARVVAASRLDRETLERWVDYLGRRERDHPFLSEWDALPASGGAHGHAAAIAGRFQAMLLAIVEEKKRIDEENRITLGVGKKKRPAGTPLPNGFVSYEDFCPGCQVEVKALSRDRYVLWNDVFGSGPRRDPEGKGRRGGVLVYEGSQIDRWLDGAWKAHLGELRAELERRRKALPARYPFLHLVGEAPAAANLRIHRRGSPYDLGDETLRAFPAALHGTGAAPFQRGSGRLELAEAIAGHPLAARVMVNRIWQHLFGQGLVRTPGNFGRLGDRPSHPELLEYLARRLVESGSVKAIIREIVLSSTYQAAGGAAGGETSADGLTGRRERRRLDVESLRDAILAVSGSLDACLGGPSVDLAADRTRRTVYGKVSRFRLEATLALFDFPHPAVTSEKRNVTQVPLQRLFYLNSDFIQEQAARLAERLAVEAPANDEARLRRAWRLLYAREPSEVQVRLGIRFLQEAAAGGESKMPPLAQLAQALLGSNEFGFLE